MKNLKVAILYQSGNIPAVNGIKKPEKEGGYSDSGADIACALKSIFVPVITPVDFPDITNDEDWVFPDTREGIRTAINKGAEILWLNTVLYKGHPVEEFMEDTAVVGQIPGNVEMYDDKWVTNELLKRKGLPVPESFLVTRDNINSCMTISFPAILKPLRGRGSQGVNKINNQEEFNKTAKLMLDEGKYGKYLYVEEYLSGEELTLTIMPPGDYMIKGKQQKRLDYWSLPPVRRFNHYEGIAPYNGTVAVVNNSSLLGEKEIENPKIKMLCAQCEQAASLVGARAPVRIDCRANKNGDYYLFDLNMKPNMTGASRPHREDQDSLSAIASKGIGWSYSDLLMNILHQYWYYREV